MKKAWRVRLLWGVLMIGNLIASPQSVERACGEYMHVTIEYARWYRPFVAAAFWLCEAAP